MNDANGVRERLRMMARVDIGEWLPTQGQRGACIGTLNKYFGDNTMRHLVLGWLFRDDFGPLSSKALTPGQWYALWNWIGFSKTDDGQTLVSDLFHNEHALVLTEALRVFNAATLEIQRQFGDEALSILRQAVALGGIATHTFYDNQEVQYDFKAAVSAASDEKEARQRQLLRELGYDVDDPADTLVNS